MKAPIRFFYITELGVTQFVKVYKISQDSLYRYHRDTDLPSAIFKNSIFYEKNNYCHREFGPAEIQANGYGAYAIYDNFMNLKDWEIWKAAAADQARNPVGHH